MFTCQNVLIARIQPCILRNFALALSNVVPSFFMHIDLPNLLNLYNKISFHLSNMFPYHK